jgi:uncharacterized protein (DUF1697 family)
MKTFIALFRGINVGGAGILPMKDLVVILETLDLRDVKTYIQSGNVVFRSTEEDPSRVSSRISAEIRKCFGFEPQVLLLDSAEMKEAIEANPFPEAESEPKTLHLSFLASVPENPDLQALEDLKKDSERFSLKGSVFYLHAPEGIGRSKLTANIEKLLGVAATSRNWRTVTSIMALARSSGSPG